MFIDGIYLKRSWGGSFENAAMMVTVSINDDGYREVIGAIAEGTVKILAHFPTVP